MLDEITEMEIEPILKRVNDNYINKWEQTRQIMFVIAQTNSRKKLRLQDIVKFPWEQLKETKYTKEEEEIVKQELLNMVNSTLA